MNSALRELFYAYKHLPVGVMLFKSGNLFFVNDHLRNVLLLASLPSDPIIEILSSMFGLEESSHSILHNFLLHNDSFIYHNSIIQIERRSANNINVFVLIKISEQTIETIDATQSLGLLRMEKIEPTYPLINEEWKLLAKALGPKFEKRKFPSVVLYKEIPIKADCRIIDIRDGMIELNIAKRQLIATAIGTEWLLGVRDDSMVLGKVERYDLQLGKIWLNNLKLVSEGFHLRNDIRYTIEKNGYFSITIKNDRILLPLHDLSEKGASVKINDPMILSELSSMIGKTFNAEVTIDDLKLTLKAIPLYIETIDISGMMKVAFSIICDSHNETLLHTWTNNEQLNLIKHVRNYVQMISGQKTDIPDE